MKRLLFCRVRCPFVRPLTLLTPAPAAAQRLDLSVSPLTISFPLSDPDTVPIVASYRRS